MGSMSMDAMDVGSMGSTSTGRSSTRGTSLSWVTAWAARHRSACSPPTPWRLC